MGHKKLRITVMIVSGECLIGMGRPIADHFLHTSSFVELPRRSSRPPAWVALAACREEGAPSMFADHWGVGRDARRHRTAALACCRTCPVRRQCGLAALADADAGLGIYGVHCGVEFTDVTPSRQARDIVRLRTVVAELQLRGAVVTTKPELAPPRADRNLVDMEASLA
jgi:hypothetical protein